MFGKQAGFCGMGAKLYVFDWLTASGDTMFEQSSLLGL